MRLLPTSLPRLLAALVVAIGVLAGAPAASAARPMGSDPLDDVIYAAQTHDEPGCGLTADELAALMLAVVFPETGAMGSVPPSPMTLSRWDRNANLFYGGDPNTGYQRAYFNPGVGMWQFDSAGLGSPHSADWWINTSTAAPAAATTMAARYCDAVDAGYTPAEVRTHVWLPWHACNSGICESIYDEIYVNGTITNLTRFTSVTRTGGMQARECRLADNTVIRCWYVNPALAQGYGAGSTAWANPAVVAPTQSPLTAPFYVYERSGREHRHWLRADTGYGVEIHASRLLGQNARAGLAWTTGPGLCDVTLQRGSCEVVPPLGPAVPGVPTHPAMVGAGSGPGVADFGAGQVAAVERRPDGTIRLATVTANGRSYWTYLGGGTASDPDVASWGTNHLDVFVRGGDDAIWHRTWNGTGWGPWQSLGGILTSAPTAVSWSPGRTDVFARGADGALWGGAITPLGWSGWYTLGGIIISDPEVASWGENRLDVFAVGNDQQLWTRAWDGRRWSAWTPLGGGLTSAPGAASAVSGRITVAARGLDGAVWSRHWTGATWTGWIPIGGATPAAPDLGAIGPDWTTVVVRGGDGWLWDSYQTGPSSFGPWRLLA